MSLRLLVQQQKTSLLYGLMVLIGVAFACSVDTHLLRYQEIPLLLRVVVLILLAAVPIWLLARFGKNLVGGTGARFSRQTVLVWLLSVMGVAVVITVVPTFVSQMLWPTATQHRLQITALGTKDSQSQGSEVWVTGLFNSKHTPFLDPVFQYQDDWTRRGGFLFTQAAKPSTLVWEGRAFGDSYLTLLTHPWSGIAEVQWDNAVQNVDLFSPSPTGKVIHLPAVETSAYSQTIAISRIIADAIILSVIILALIIAGVVMLERRSQHLLPNKGVSTNSEIALLIVATVIAYHGVGWLGLASDDYTNLWVYRTTTWMNIIVDPRFNRFPLFSWFVYPTLLQMPVSLVHIFIVCVQLCNALMLRSLLMWFNFNTRTATLAALLFILWPATNEALFWIVASTVIFGLGFVLAGILLVTINRTILGCFLIFCGTLFSEGLFFPSLFLLLIVLIYKHVAKLQTLLFIGLVGGLYSIFQLFRAFVSQSERLTEYPTSLDNVAVNLRDLLAMSTGVFSSMTVTRYWNYDISSFLVDAGLLLPVISVFLAVVIIWMIAHCLEKDFNTVAPKFKVLTISSSIAIIGYFSSLLVFLIISGNMMQARYAFTSVIYLCVLLAIIIGALWTSKNKIVQSVGLICVVMLCSWSLYRTWSNVWMNWYPASTVSKQIIADVQWAYKQSGVNRIFLVNEPKVVGNGQAIAWDASYGPAGRMFVNPQLNLSSMDAINPTVIRGERFADEPCMFLSWKNGQPLYTTKLLIAENIELNCDTGIAEQYTEQLETPKVLYYTSLAGRERLQAFLGRNIEQIR